MKMKIVWLILTGFILLSGFNALADDISMSSEQTDYYFLAGTDAKVPFIIESSFQNTIPGQLQYSLTEHQDGGGFSLSKISTQSQSFPIAPGRSNHGLSLSSETTTDFDLSLILLYSRNTQDYAAILPTISVHFVSDMKDIKQEKNTVRSTTSEATKTPSSSSQSDPFAAMDEQMEQMRQEQQQLMQNFMSMSSSSSKMSSSSQQSSQNPQQALQNNQMSSSGEALKQQMMAESQQSKEEKEKLSESLEQDPLLQQQASELRDAGYNQTNGRIVSTGPDSGEVSIDFENYDSEKVSLTGKAEDSKISSLKAEKSGEIPVPQELASNSTWNDMKNDLHNNSMTPTSGTVTRTPNNTTVKQNYSALDGRNTTLSARIVNGTVEEVILEEEKEFPVFWLLGILLIIILIVLCAGITWWYFSTRKDEVMSNQEIVIPVRDFKEVVWELIGHAEKSYVSGDKKEGYALLGQAVRVYISGRFGVGESFTSEEIVSGKCNLSIPEKDRIYQILNACSTVEYIRGAPVDDDFFAMLSDIKAFISDGPKNSLNL
ncbi:hypothetical protein ACKUB1_16445 [Methanospirillum stamsii]|uniref:DUF4129 domain-containing protein n=1 Tax=Methanospirillum stamsii TaxID=1277351 RepID=A0A2V2N8L6_9EURY|nr:hypothetical protein [Methanospirillum stamsii]PWR75020.1 hypothetical protein DLD82_07305 [Methanospirillum stamsii]